MRGLHLDFPYRVSGNTRYPFEPLDPQDDSEKTAVHQLIDLGDAAVPALIEALEDESFPRTANGSLHAHPTRAMRVNDFALAILEHLASRRFPHETDGQRYVIARSRPFVEEWWAMRQRGEN